MERIERITTGVPGLDRLLDGGLRAGALHLIAGPPGTGKTVLAHQIGSHVARSGETVLYLTALVESHRSLQSQARQFEFFEASWVGRSFYYTSLYTDLLERGVAGVGTAIAGLVREHAPKLVVIDGLHVIKAAARGAFDFARLMNELQTLGALGGPTILAIANVVEERPGGDEFTLSDGILRLAHERSGRGMIRTIEIRKLRGGNPLPGANTFTISLAGIHVYPRLEGRVGREGLPPRTPDKGMLRFDIPGLDAMLGGGVGAASTTLILGVPGSAKTLIGLSFAAGGTRDGPALFVGFHETPDRLVEKAEHIGIGMRAAVDEGRTHILWKPSVELVVDPVIEEVLDFVDRHGVRRLVIDGLDDVVRMLGLEGRLTALTNAFTGILRSRGVCTVLTQESRTLFGLEFQLPVAEVSAAIDNILLLRYVELRARLRRLASVLKVREHDYDPRIREFDITDRGIQVGEPLAEAEAVLSGLGRVTEPRRGGGG